VAVIDMQFGHAGTRACHDLNRRAKFLVAFPTGRDDAADIQRLRLEHIGLRPLLRRTPIRDHQFAVASVTNFARIAADLAPAIGLIGHFLLTQH
jgi:hypothetical protein